MNDCLVNSETKNKNTPNVSVGSEFRDLNKQGKDRNWKERKTRNLELAEAFEKLNYKKSFVENISGCADTLNFILDGEGDEQRLRLYQMFSCKNKQCPICSWRRSMKYQFENSEVVTEAMRRFPKARFLFMTLTVKNITGDQLNSEMSKLTKSFDRLFRRAKLKKNLIGYIRATEVTVNEKDGTYHPHIHVLMMVKSTYFKNSQNYISQEELSSMWKKSANLNYDPIVNIQAVKPKMYQGKESIHKAVIETSKYPVKPPKDYSNIKVINDFQKGLFKKRQVGYGGELKEIRNELFGKDVEEDLINIGDEKELKTIDENAKKIIVRWMNNNQNYYVIANDYEN